MNPEKSGGRHYIFNIFAVTVHRLLIMCLQPYWVFSFAVTNTYAISYFHTVSIKYYLKCLNSVFFSFGYAKVSFI